MTKKKRCLFRQTLLVASLFVIFSGISFAKPGIGHARDIEDAFGSKYSEGPITFEFLKNTGYNLIDSHFDCKIFQQVLLNRNGPDVSFAGADGIHRILFHWGYDTHPSSFEPLQRYLREKGLTDEEARKITGLIAIEWQLRKARAVASFGFKLKGRDKLKAHLLCALAYNIHLLGDYGGSGSEYMAPPADTINSTIKYVSYLEHSGDLLRSLKGEHVPSAVLHILKSHLPQVLQKNFKL